MQLIVFLATVATVLSVPWGEVPSIQEQVETGVYVHEVITAEPYVHMEPIETHHIDEDITAEPYVHIEPIETEHFGVCDQPAGVGGPCYAYMPRWTFNRATRTCEQFVYGGCQGNKNSFGSKAECEKKCGVTFGKGIVFARDHMGPNGTILDHTGSCRTKPDHTGPYKSKC